MIIFENIYIVALALCVGSFLNVCIYRMPKSESIVTPRSYCPKCKKQIAGYDNIPVFSYLLLRGKCRNCKEKISPRYALVELITAILFLAIIRTFGLNLYSIGLLIFASGLIVSSFIDIDCREIPDIISVGGTCLGIILSGFTLMPRAGVPDFPAFLISFIGGIVGIGLLFLIMIIGFTLAANFTKDNKESEPEISTQDPKELIINFIVILVGFILGWKFFHLLVPVINQQNSWFAAVLRSLMGASIGTALIYMTGLFGDIVFRKETMGGGDVKFLAMIGSFLGWPGAVLTFFMSTFIGALIGIAHKIKTKESYFPFGPSIAIAALLFLFWSGKIIGFVLHRLY